MNKLGKVLLITNIPNPYRIPLFNELNRQLKIKNIRLKVIFGGLGYARRKWVVDLSKCEFDFKVLPSRKIALGNSEKVLFSYKGLTKTLKNEKPDIIIVVGFSLATMKLWLRSCVNSVRYIIWSGCVDRNRGLDDLLRRQLRKILVRRAKRFIAYGTKAKDYLVSLGAKPERIVIALNTVDTHYFSKNAEQMRERTGPPPAKKKLLCVGYLTPGKNIPKLLSIVKILSERRADFVLDMVGDGVDRARLEKFVVDNKMENFIKFHGFKQQYEILRFLAEADCFLFQSDYDIWGLVLNEAMAAGLPCISSIRAGATHDLIIDGVTGFAVDFMDRKRTIELINWILDNPKQANAIGENASRYIRENASIERSAACFVEAILRPENR